MRECGGGRELGSPTRRAALDSLSWRDARSARLASGRARPHRVARPRGGRAAAAAAHAADRRAGGGRQLGSLVRGVGGRLGHPGGPDGKKVALPCTGFGQLALRRLLSALEHACGHPEPLSASCGQPASRFGRAAPIGLAFDNPTIHLPQAPKLFIDDVQELRGATARAPLAAGEELCRVPRGRTLDLASVAQGESPCGKQGLYGRPERPKAADWPRLAGAWGSLRHALALRQASGDPAGRGLSHLAFHVGESPCPDLAPPRLWSSLAWYDPPLLTHPY
eukprot:scaffold71995_cov51-Phaeocystis_antarctica.AAC.1